MKMSVWNVRIVFLKTYYQTTMYWKSTILIAESSDEGEGRSCQQFQEIKKYNNDYELDSCVENTDPADAEKVITTCLCSESLCNTSTMLNGGMVLVFALMGIFMLKIWLFQHYPNNFFSLSVINDSK